MSNFIVKQSAGDSNGQTYAGQTGVINASNNFTQINAQSVPHNASIVATTAPGTTPGDITIYSGTVVYTDVIGMTFLCALAALNGNILIPQVYVKLLLAHGSSHDLVIPMIPGQIFTWTNPLSTINSVNNVIQPNNTYDANGNAFTLETGAAIILPTALAANIVGIAVTPDKYSDVTISGCIELAV